MTCPNFTTTSRSRSVPTPHLLPLRIPLASENLQQKEMSTSQQCQEAALGKHMGMKRTMIRASSDDMVQVSQKSVLELQSHAGPGSLLLTKDKSSLSMLRPLSLPS